MHFIGIDLGTTNSVVAVEGDYPDKGEIYGNVTVAGADASSHSKPQIMPPAPRGGATNAMRVDTTINPVAPLRSPCTFAGTVAGSSSSATTGAV